MRTLRWKLPTIGLVLILLVSGCKSDPATTPSPTAAPTDVPEATVAPTAAAASPTPVAGDPSEPVLVTPPEEPGVCEAAPLPELPVRPVDDTDRVKGACPEDAEITIYEYSDFQCPGCGGMYPVLQAFVDEYPNVRVVYRHFPLDFHQHAGITAEASEAAAAEGKFWEMHDLLFDRTAQWSQLPDEEVRATLSEYAAELGLDVEAFDAALDDGTYRDKVQAHYEESRVLNLPGTPSFLFNGVLFPAEMGLSFRGMEAFMTMLQNKDEIFFDAAPEMTVDIGGTYEAILRTSKGDIRVNLLPESAPAAVNSFMFLSSEQWYDGSDFFFVRDNFVAVTGDPTNTTVGYPGYYCVGEELGVFDRAGLVGMLSNGQFFVTLGMDAAQLDSQFALIGQVTEGLDVLDELSRVVVGDPSSPVPDVLESVEIVQ